MIYIFEVLGTDWIKLGYTANNNVYDRIKINGFYTNKHPVEVCNKLGAKNLELLFVFQGEEYFEKTIKILYPSNVGEFYPKYMCNIFVNILKYLTEQAPQNPRPHDSFFEQPKEFLPCCGGQVFKCSICGKEFKREHKLYEHKREVHQKRNRVICDCGKEILQRNLKRHKQDSCSSR